MPFEGDGGWGKCTLRSKRSISSYTIYEFALPESYYTVPLVLGQQLDFCCLSPTDDICTGSFYLYHNDDGTRDTGVVRVVLPNDKEMDEGSSKFVSDMPTFLCQYEIRLPASAWSFGVGFSFIT